MTEEIPAFVCSHIFEKRTPVLLVSRADGDWQLLCGGTHEATEVPHVVCLNHLVDNDPSLNDIYDLPPEWEAERASADGPWERRPSEE